MNTEKIIKIVGQIQERLEEIKKEIGFSAVSEKVIKKEKVELNKKKKAQLTTQVLCALMLTGAALPGQDVLAATITDSQPSGTYSTSTDDIDIANGYICTRRRQRRTGHH